MQKQNHLLSEEHLICFTPSPVHKPSETTSIHPCLKGRRSREQQHTCVCGDLSLGLGSFLARLFVLTRDFPALHSGLISRLQTCPFLTFCVCLCPGSRLHFWTAFVFAFPVPDLGVVFRCQIYLLLWIICLWTLPWIIHSARSCIFGFTVPDFIDWSHSACKLILLIFFFNKDVE